MRQRNCLSCQTITGKSTPPGGIIYKNDHWLVFLDACPLLVSGQGFIVLKRHCETLEELTDNELATLGPVMRYTSQAMTRVLQPQRYILAYTPSLSGIFTGTFSPGCPIFRPVIFPLPFAWPGCVFGNDWDSNGRIHVQKWPR